MLKTTLRFACALALAVSAPVLAGCEDTDTTTTEPEPPDEPNNYEVSDAVVGVPDEIAPASTFDAVITVTNSGDATWQPGDVRMLWAGDLSWGSADLQLQAETLPGGQATFLGTVTAPPQTGRHALRWQPVHANVLFGAQVGKDATVTCDDHVFCNGAERFADGQCQPGAPPCDDGADCTTDTCDDASGWCGHELGAGCDACLSDCAPDCTGKVCGDDGCGGSCGACDAGQGCASATGICQPADLPGTCASPLPLLADGVDLVGSHTIFGDTSAALHQAVPTCNSTSTAVEVVYVFTTDETVGIDARSYGYDTVLHLRKEDAGTAGNECLDDTPAATVGCSDDASPPGDYGSRVAVTLDPGTYYLIVDGFDSTQFGAFQLDVKVVENGCVPQCDGQYCGGDDGCGGDCGTCEEGFACVDSKCQPDPCVPACEGKECGDDGCGGECGQCDIGLLCVPATGLCQSFDVCNHDLPTCDPPCGEGQFCGTDCACHGVNDPMPDLVLNADRLKEEILFDELMFDEKSCAVAEGCVSGTGLRKLLRFSVEAVNQGQTTLDGAAARRAARSVPVLDVPRALPLQRVRHVRAARSGGQRGGRGPQAGLLHGGHRPVPPGPERRVLQGARLLVPGHPGRLVGPLRQRARLPVARHHGRGPRRVPDPGLGQSEPRVRGDQPRQQHGDGHRHHPLIPRGSPLFTDCLFRRCPGERPGGGVGGWWFSSRAARITRPSENRSGEYSRI